MSARRRTRRSRTSAELKEPPDVPVALGLEAPPALSQGALSAASRHPAAARGREARDQVDSDGSRTCGAAASSAGAGCAAAGNCSTVARWPSHRRVSSTTCPSGNSNASWWVTALSMLICRKRASRCPIFLFGRMPIPNEGSHSTFCSNAISVPGSRETAGDGIVELGGHQLVLDLGRPGRDMVQTIVTHRRGLLFL